jgi:hypothetical protein
MMYVLRHPSGLYQVNTNIAWEDLVEKMKSGEDMLSLFDIEGGFVGVVPAEFLDECEIFKEVPLIPIDEVKHPYEDQGYLAMVYPYDKAEILQILDDMRIEREDESKQALEYFLTERPEEFLERLRNTTFNKGTLGRCIINEEDKTLAFLSKHGALLQPIKDRFFIIGGTIWQYKDSDRYQLCFIPAPKGGALNREYK